MNTTISVIITTYNRAVYLKEAIDSVLNQSFKNFELIIIDDGSTDDTKNRMASYGKKIRYHRQDNQGTNVAMNKGIELAKAPYLAFLDSDDLWLSDKLAKQYEVLSQDKALDGVFGHMQEFISPELSEQNKLKLTHLAKTMEGYLSGALLARAEAFQRVGLFDPEQNPGGFIDWYVRAKHLNLNFKMLDDVVMQRRIHLSNYGLTHRQDYSKYLQIVRKNMALNRSKR